MRYRTLKNDETALLRDLLYEAIFIPEGMEPPAREIIEQPELKLYYDGFGTGKADYCIVADDEGKVIGAVWTRIMKDYGHVDDETPSFAISLFTDRRLHHEIYLSDARKVEPEKLKTVIRHPIRKA